MTTDVNQEYEALRRESFGWIKAAARIALERLGRADVTRKHDKSPVTDADHAVQDALLASIAKLYPQDAVITEEIQSRPDVHQPVSRSGRCWVIDPIDGTRNYVRAIPVFTVSVAVMENGQPVVGMVYDPVADRMYSASIGAGAWVNADRIERREVPTWNEVYMGIPTSKHEQLPPVVHRWIDTMVVRNFGSTAMHLSLLATGSLDAVYCKKSKLWDIAAGAVIACETGAEVLSLDGREHFPMDLSHYANEPLPMIAARPDLVERLLAEYRTAQMS
ncbi:MAG TPA: inositol monophosphatase [Phycisphaerae bacterium]|nr:inositol monophosphatase [Phycisphaerae bacterium]